MDAATRIERTLDAALLPGEAPEGPPLLAAAVRHAVFPGGARIRPRLCLAVAMACGDDSPEITNAAAAAIELMHCASLVHDDLPCFDDAPVRRGKPSVHAAFGEQLAVLAGDALIVLAFDVLALGAKTKPDRLVPLLQLVARSVGLPSGISAGQAWECEPHVDLVQYHRSKTGSLFGAATQCGARAAGQDHLPWQALGEKIGEAFQVADDIRDAAGDPDKLGKPVGVDALLDRPSAVRELGLVGAIHKLEAMVEDAANSVPDCRGAEPLRAQIKKEAAQFLPKDIWILAA